MFNIVCLKFWQQQWVKRLAFAGQKPYSQWKSRNTLTEILLCTHVLNLCCQNFLYWQLSGFFRLIWNHLLRRLLTASQF